ncbi:uncharacterized protein LOC119535945 [Choloepus didactylus]|uniref:uncharacterized protein LOC119535945 n=1 Tax=Choloepus didactylus TaxID=27675 RepID=UPI00189FEB1B|nr:uncharacterized protein LOC119535945 [Choloepus didactylus]
MADSTAQGSQGHQRDQTRRGGRGGVTGALRAGVGAGQGLGGAGGTGLRSPWPRRAEAGSDGAGIGAFCAQAGDEARSPAGGRDSQSRRARASGRRRAEQDMTWSGETGTGAGCPSFLAEHSGLALRGMLQLVPQLSRRSRHITVLFGPPKTLKMKWCCPAHAWALDSGTFSSPSSSEQDDAAFRNHCSQGPAPRLRQRNEPPTQQRRHHQRQQRPRHHPSGDTILVATRALGRRAHRAPATPELALPQPGRPHVALPLSSSSSFSPLSSSLFSSLSCARETRRIQDSVPHSSPNSICTKSFALVWSPGGGPESPRVSVRAAECEPPWAAPPAPDLLHLGAPGRQVCVGPRPALAWSGSSSPSEPNPETFHSILALCPSSPGLLQKPWTHSINTVTASRLRDLESELLTWGRGSRRDHGGEGRGGAWGGGDTREGGRLGSADQVSPSQGLLGSGTFGAEAGTVSGPPGLLSREPQIPGPSQALRAPCASPRVTFRGRPGPRSAGQAESISGPARKQGPAGGVGTAGGPRCSLRLRLSVGGCVERRLPERERLHSGALCTQEARDE